MAGTHKSIPPTGGNSYNPRSKFVNFGGGLRSKKNMAEIRQMVEKLKAKGLMKVEPKRRAKRQIAEGIENAKSGTQHAKAIREKKEPAIKIQEQKPAITPKLEGQKTEQPKTEKTVAKLKFTGIKDLGLVEPKPEKVVIDVPLPPKGLHLAVQKPEVSVLRAKLNVENLSKYVPGGISPRVAHQMVAVGEWIYVIGGQTNRRAAIADNWRFNTTTLRFERLLAKGTETAFLRAGHVARAIDDNVIIAGDNSGSGPSEMFIWDTSHEKGYSVAGRVANIGIPAPMSGMNDFFLEARSGTLYLYLSRPSTDLAIFKSYDMADNKWKELKTPKKLETSVTVRSIMRQNNIFFFQIGFEHGVRTSNVQRYNIKSKEWVDITPLLPEKLRKDPSYYNVMPGPLSSMILASDVITRNLEDSCVMELMPDGTVEARPESMRSLVFEQFLDNQMSHAVNAADGSMFIFGGKSSSGILKKDLYRITAI